MFISPSSECLSGLQIHRNDNNVNLSYCILLSADLITSGAVDSAELQWSLLFAESELSGGRHEDSKLGISSRGLERSDNGLAISNLGI